MLTMRNLNLVSVQSWTYLLIGGKASCNFSTETKRLQDQLKYHTCLILSQAFVKCSCIPLNSPHRGGIHCKKKDRGCTFDHNTLRTKLSPLGI